jgi:hypothetical protein
MTGYATDKHRIITFLINLYSFHSIDSQSILHFFKGDILEFIFPLYEKLDMTAGEEGGSV